jgi:hypothetical protein
MEYTSRKQRQKDLRSQKDEKEIERDSFEEQIFKEQKKRLRRQLNSVSTFAIDANDVSSDKTTRKTRGEIKKQKKIDEILKDIAVLPDNEYLNEDTNLRILKKMSVAKQYDKLRLSPEQEKKMAENREKFTNITNQLLFLIQELEKNKIDEPEIGEVPTVSSKALNIEQRKKMFDIELAKTVEQEIVKEYELNTALADNIEEIEQKLEQTTIKNDELEDVLQKLEAVVAEGKRIAHDEIANTKAEQALGQAPEDTLELLDFLQRLEKMKNDDSIALANVEENVEENVEHIVENKEMKLNLEALVMEAKKEFSQAELADQKRYGDTTTINATDDEQVLSLLQKQTTTDQAEMQQVINEIIEKQTTIEEEKASSLDTVNKVETQKSPVSIVQSEEQEAKQEPLTNNDERVQELESVKIEESTLVSEQPKPVEVTKTSPSVIEETVKETGQSQVVETAAPITKKIVSTTNNNETKVIEKKETDFLGKSIIILGVFFILLLIAFVIFVVYMLQIGAIEF